MDERERVARSLRIAAALFRRNVIAQRPILVRARVETNRKLFAPAREINETIGSVERGTLAVTADVDDRRLFFASAVL